MNHFTYENRATVYDDARDVFGSENQLIVALEELSEAQKEICKALRGEIHLDQLAEEVADATIMLEQIRRMFGINETVNTFMDRKIERLRRRTLYRIFGQPGEVTTR
jgi:uncharacterized protein YabN with tetrapyrrole methylase and pyrophosphatase domain